MTENHILKQMTFEASFYREMQRTFPDGAQASRCRLRAACRIYTVIQIEPRYAGEARQAILAAMASNQRPKWVIAVDPDIDITRSSEVEWALSFRVHPGRDVIRRRRSARRGPADPLNQR